MHLSSFARTCRQCFMEKGLSVLLVQDSITGDWYCPQNINHETNSDDVSVA